jgi:glutathione S-transferase
MVPPMGLFYRASINSSEEVEKGMKLYWCPNTRAFRIAWLMEESGLRYERIFIDIRNAEAKSDPAFRAVSPMGKVPSLEDGPTRLNDSGAICIYIADQYPQARLGPPVGHPDRGSFLQWVLFTNSVVEPAMVEKFAKLDVSPTARGWGSYDLMLTTLRNGLSGREWIVGSQFTAADVLVGQAAFWLQQFKLLGDDPVISPYVARCQARPAFKRAQQFEAAGA